VKPIVPDLPLPSEATAAAYGRQLTSCRICFLSRICPFGSRPPCAVSMHKIIETKDPSKPTTGHRCLLPSFFPPCPIELIPLLPIELITRPSLSPRRQVPPLVSIARSSSTSSSRHVELPWLGTLVHQSSSEPFALHLHESTWTDQVPRSMSL
jgi:hypothetical protein